MIQFDEHVFRMRWNQLVQDLDTKNMIFICEKNRTAPKKNPWQMFWKKLQKRQDKTWNNLLRLSDIIPSVAKNSVGISNVSLAIYQFLISIRRSFFLVIPLLLVATSCSRSWRMDDQFIAVSLGKEDWCRALESPFGMSQEISKWLVNG